jgi:hypothetical protein
MQGSLKSNEGVFATTRMVIRQYGFLGLFRGISAMFTGAGITKYMLINLIISQIAPAHALHFATYEFWKNLFGGTGSKTEGHRPVQTALSGVLSTVFFIVLNDSK